MTESVMLLWKSRYEQCRSKDIDPVTDPNRIFPAAGDGSCACGSGISDDPPAAGNAEPDNVPLFVTCLLVTILVFTAIYYLVFRITSRAYYKIVSR